MVYSEQDIQSYVLEGKDLPKFEFSEKVDEIQENFKREQYINFTRVSALLWSLVTQGKIKSTDYALKQRELSNLVGETSSEFSQPFYFFEKNIRENTAIWKIAGVDAQTANLGQAFLDGRINWPGLDEQKIVSGHGYHRILVMPPADCLHETLINYIEKQTELECTLPQEFERNRATRNVGEVFATSTVCKTSMAPNELTGPISTYADQLMKKMRELRAENSNCHLHGMNLDEFMLDKTAKYLDYRKTFFDREIRLKNFREDLTSPMFLLGEFQNGKYLNVSECFHGGYKFDYSSNEGPDVALKISFEKEGLINGL